MDTEQQMKTEQAAALERMMQEGSVKLVMGNDGLRDPRRVEPDYDHMMTVCVEALQRSKNQKKPHGVVLPILEAADTKKNRVRLVPWDRKSPMGVVVKNDPYAAAKWPGRACAKFNPYDMIRFCGAKMAGQEIDGV